jgi:hypothetical protein
LAGRSIRQALEFMAPYADPAQPWPYQQIKPPGWAALAVVLFRANRVYRDPQFTAALKHFPTQDLAACRERMLFPLEEVPTHQAKGRKSGCVPPFGQVPAWRT